MQRDAYSAYDRAGRRKYLSRSEGRAFLKATRKLALREALFCRAIYYTGMRISEALALTSQDVDSHLGVICIRTLKKRGTLEFRRVPVPTALISGLGSISTEAPNGKLWAFSRTTGWRIIKRVMMAAGIEGVHATTKGLRHAFGVRGVMAGIPQNLLQMWFGHSQSSSTAVYLDVRDEEERALMRKTWK